MKGTEICHLGIFRLIFLPVMLDVLPQNRSQLHSKGLGTLCSWVGTWKRYHDSRYHIRKVYHSFLLKMVYKRWGVGPQGEVSPYKSLLTTPPPLSEGREGRSYRWVCRWNPQVRQFKWKVCSSTSLCCGLWCGLWSCGDVMYTMQGFQPFKTG